MQVKCGMMSPVTCRGKYTNSSGASMSLTDIFNFSGDNSQASKRSDIRNLNLNIPKTFCLLDVRTRDNLVCPDWSDWSPCSPACGGGTQNRTNRNCPDNNSHKYGGGLLYEVTIIITCLYFKY